MDLDGLLDALDWEQDALEVGADPEEVWRRRVLHDQLHDRREALDEAIWELTETVLLALEYRDDATDALPGRRKVMHATTEFLGAVREATAEFDSRPAPVLLTPTHELPISVRSYNLLRRYGITTVEDLARHTERELLAIPGIGPGAVQEIRRALEKVGSGLAG